MHTQQQKSDSHLSRMSIFNVPSRIIGNNGHQLTPPSRGDSCPTQMVKRPHWKKDANRLRRMSKKHISSGSFDLAHRFPYQGIRNIVKSKDIKRINRLTGIIAIPKRRFGSIPKGDKKIYNRLKKIIDDYQAAPSELLEKLLTAELNSVPFNLRPGDQSLNRSIGGRVDRNIDESGRVTPQSLAAEKLGEAEGIEIDPRSSTVASDTKIASIENDFSNESR